MNFWLRLGTEAGVLTPTSRAADARGPRGVGRDLDDRTSRPTNRRVASETPRGAGVETAVG